MKTNRASGLDVVTKEVAWTRLIAIADEMAASFRRVAFSPFVREVGDFSCVLLDAIGESIAQATIAIPSFAATLPPSTRHFLRRFPAETLRPGDVLITNDPYLGTGHLPDITMVSPIFYRGRLIGFAGSIFHTTDVGGRPPDAEARDMFEEGLRIPPTKLYIEGEPDEMLMEWIEWNVREPDYLRGDIEAVVASNEKGAEGLRSLMSELGLDDVELLGESIKSHAESVMREAIRALPDGDYVGETLLDGYGEATRLHLTLRVRGDEILLDFTGSSPQSAAGINCVPVYAFGYSIYPLKCVLDPSTPNNEGSFRAVHFEAPLGCILNPIPPVPVNARGLTGHGLQACVFEALSQVVPDRVQADSGTPVWVLSITGHRDETEKPFVGLFFINGGQGGKSDEDGISCIAFPSCVYNTPAEICEQELPILVECREIIPDSGGPGRMRGGCGQRVTLTNRSSRPVEFHLMTERLQHPARGLLGGQPGRRGSIRYANGDPIARPKGPNYLQPGDWLTFETAGGGGFGPSSERPIELIRADIANRYVTAGRVEQDYGFTT